MFTCSFLGCDAVGENVEPPDYSSSMAAILPARKLVVKFDHSAVEAWLCAAQSTSEYDYSRHSRPANCLDGFTVSPLHRPWFAVKCTYSTRETYYLTA
jgi:hypothetical protein